MESARQNYPLKKHKTWPAYSLFSPKGHTFAHALELQGWLPEWPNGADCKSAGSCLRWFESITTHIDYDRNKPLLSNPTVMACFVYLLSHTLAHPHCRCMRQEEPIN